MNDWTDLQHHAYVRFNLRWVFGELLRETETQTASMLGLHDPNCYKHFYFFLQKQNQPRGEIKKKQQQPQTTPKEECMC